MIQLPIFSETRATLLSMDMSIAAISIGLKLEAGDPMDEDYLTISEALKIRKR